MFDLIVRVSSAADEDGDEAAGLARRLRAELLDLDVEMVEPLTTDTAPEGAKAGAASLVGMLGVRLGAAGLKAVLSKIRDWVSRNGRSVEVTIDGDTIKVTGATAEQQEKIMNVWLARHASGS
ncbi:MAG TPA: hypothetical protein VFZ32_08680 [Micromonosporaceae bacterium]